MSSPFISRLRELTEALSSNVGVSLVDEARRDDIPVSLATILEQLPVGVFFTDGKGHCLYVNAEWRRLSGLAFAEALGHGWKSAIAEDDRETVFGEWYRAAMHRDKFSGIYRFVDRSGSEIWVSCVSTEVMDGDNVAGYIGVIMDLDDEVFDFR